MPRNGAIKLGPVGSDLPESGILLVDMSLKPIASDRGAFNILRAEPHTSDASEESQFSIPAELVEAIRSRNPADMSCATSHFLIGKRKYRCRSYVVHGENGHSGAPIMAVHFETDGDTADLATQVASEYNLTDREEEALRGIALGLTTKELADRMNISPNTVKAFVRLIMIKLGVTTRTAIIGKLLERNDAK